MPAWAQSGSGAFIFNEARVFLGLGVAGDVGDVGGHALTLATADRAAVLAVVEVLDEYATVAERAYGALDDVGEGSRRQREARQVVMTFTGSSVATPPIVDHWFCPAGTVLALAHIELDRFLQALDLPEYGQSPIHIWMRHNGIRLFDELSNRDRPE